MDATYLNFGARPTQLRFDRVLTYSFWAICIIGLWNINGLTAMMFKTNRIMSVAFLGFGLLVLLRSNQWKKSIGRSGTAFIVFVLAYLSFATIIRHNTVLLIGHMNSIFIVVVSAVATRKIVQSKGLPYLMKWVLILTVLGALTVYLSPFMSSVYAKTEKLARFNAQGRWMGFFGNPNSTGMAGVAALGVCLAGWTLSSKEFPFKKYIPFLVAILGLGVLLTFCRSAIILYGGLGLAYALVTFKFNKQMLGVLFGAMVLVVLSVWFFTSGYKQYNWTPGQLRRITSVERIMKGQSESADTGGRMTGITGGLHYWSKSPLIGHGLGSLHRMPVSYFGGLGCHNTHVMLLGEAGIIGFIPYLSFLALFGWTSWRAKYKPVQTFCLAFFITFLAAGMVSHDILQDRNLNILLGVCLGLLSLEKQLRQPHQPAGSGYQLVPPQAQFYGNPTHRVN